MKHTLEYMRGATDADSLERAKLWSRWRRSPRRDRDVAHAGRPDPKQATAALCAACARCRIRWLGTSFG